jgi:parvulin-like peptidyl-prolyl isomerase
MVMGGRTGRWALALLLGAVPGCKAKDNEAIAAAPASATAAVPAAPGGPAARPTDPNAPLPEPLPKVAARVNDKEISSARVKAMAENAITASKIPEAQRPAVYRQMLQRLVMRELLVAEALSHGLAIDEKQLEAAATDARAKYKTDQEWTAYLEKQGIAPDEFRSDLRKDYTAGTVMQQEAETVAPASITEADMKRYYDEHGDQFTVVDRMRVSQILIRAPEGADRKLLRAKAEGLLKQVRTPGADFAKLAQAHSEEKVSAAKGGELDVFGRGQMPPELAAFEQAAGRLQAGQISDVVETKAGFHIIKMLERLGDQKVELGTVHDALQRYLLQARRNEAIEALVSRLRAKAKIETYL